MCWYSQSERLPSRRAVEGEELVVAEIPGHSIRWPVSSKDPQKPVCLPDRCSLRLTGIPQELQTELSVSSEAVAEFREVYERPRKTILARIFLDPPIWRDVVLFPNDRFLAVSRLPLGMSVDVLSPAVVLPPGIVVKSHKVPSLEHATLQS